VAQKCCWACQHAISQVKARSVFLVLGQKLQAFFVAQKKLCFGTSQIELKKRERLASKVVGLVLSFHQKVAWFCMLLHRCGLARLSFSKDSLFWTKKKS